MEIIVLGSGMIGTTTAYFLARRGARVTVIDRQPDPALETRFANAGQISPGYASPWAAPGIPLKALKWLAERHAPLIVRPDGSLFQLAWMLAMWRECSPERYTLNKSCIMRLAEYSRQTLKSLRAEENLVYEGRTLGTTQLFRTAAQLEAAKRDMTVLTRFGVPHEVLAPSALATLSHVVRDLFPGATDSFESEFWTGMRPMTPDSTPIVGPTPLKNLFTNTVHGTLGWTMACGSGKLVADLITEHAPEISPDGLALDRYRRERRPRQRPAWGSAH